MYSNFYTKGGYCKIQMIPLNEDWQEGEGLFITIFQENVTGFRCINKKIDSEGNAVHRT
jgi:hypothetical protein